MRLSWGHICSRADFDNGIWTLHDLADGYSVRPDGMVGLEDQAQLALLFHAHPDESQVQKFRLTLTDGSGKPHADPSEIDVHFVNIGNALPRIGPKRITLCNDWNLPGSAGDLTFSVYDVGGHRLGRVPLPVFPPDSFAPAVAPIPVGRTIPQEPFRLTWAHLAERCEVDPQTHTLTLHKVFDSLRLPPSLDFLLLAQVCLAVQITGDATAGPDHVLKIQPVDENGTPLDWQLERQIRFLRLKEGAIPLCGTLFNLSDQLMVGSTIEFKFFVGDRYIDSLTLNVQRE